MACASRSHKKIFDVVICGAGASGIFCAGRLRQLRPDLSIKILEATNNVLRKVKISGGGRCNVTSGLFWADFPKGFQPRTYRQLDSFYPRGGSALGKSFSKFGFEDIVDWFETRGVDLVREDDGRVFPSTNDSQTIIDVLLSELNGLPIDKRCKVVRVQPQLDGTHVVVTETKRGDSRFEESFRTKNVVLSPGSSRPLWQTLNSLGIRKSPVINAASLRLHWLLQAVTYTLEYSAVASPVPSLFTLNLENALEGLAGISVPTVTVSAPEISDTAVSGPIVVTHRGLSGPAVLKLSSLLALEFHRVQYQTSVEIDWTGGYVSYEELLQAFQRVKAQQTSGKVKTGLEKLGFSEEMGLPKRLWSRLVNGEDYWKTFAKVRQHEVAARVKSMRLSTTGKSTFKEEFVTAGGVELDAVTSDFELSALPNIFCIGEFVNIDGVTGGFNFSSCWTSGWAAANAIARQWKTT